MTNEKTVHVSFTIYPDMENPDNSDWTKQYWDLPPYKSKAFFDLIPEKELPEFRKLLVYRKAVENGLIKDDKWVGE